MLTWFVAIYRLVSLSIGPYTAGVSGEIKGPI
jgi:hypothetical protein